jgi:hypothetical protein
VRDLYHCGLNDVRLRLGNDEVDETRLEILRIAAGYLI